MGKHGENGVFLNGSSEVRLGFVALHPHLPGLPDLGYCDDQLLGCEAGDGGGRADMSESRFNMI